MAENNGNIQWHLSWGGQTYGPFDLEAIRGKVASGELDLKASHAWRPGYEGWKPCLEVEELAALQSLVPPPPPPPVSPPPPPAMGTKAHNAPFDARGVAISDKAQGEGVEKTEMEQSGARLLKKGPRLQLFPENAKEERQWKDEVEDLWVFSLEQGLTPRDNEFHCGMLPVSVEASHELNTDDDFERYTQTFDEYGYVGRRGNWLIQPSYWKAHRFSEGIARVSEWGYSGQRKTLKCLHGNYYDKEIRLGGCDYETYIKNDGNEVNSAVRTFYGNLSDYSEGRAWLSHKTYEYKYGLVSRDGNWIVKPIFDEVCDFLGGWAPVKVGEKWGFIDRQGNWAVKPTFDKAFSCFGEACGIVKVGEKWGSIDRQGQWVVKTRFDGIRKKFNDLACVKVAGKWGYLDRQGNWAIKPLYDNAFVFAEARARVSLKDKCGFIDREGKMIIEPVFDASVSGGFHEGLAKVGINKKYGYIDRNGEWAVWPVFDEAGYFSEGLAVVELEGKKGWIRNPCAPDAVKGGSQESPFMENLSGILEGCAGKIGFHLHRNLEPWHANLVKSAFEVEWDRKLLAFSGIPEEPFDSGIIFTDTYACTRGPKGDTRMEYAEWSKGKMDQVRSMVARTVEDPEGRFRDGEFWRLLLRVLESCVAGGKRGKI